MKIDKVIGLALIGASVIGATAAAASAADPQVTEELVVTAPFRAHPEMEEIVVTAKAPERIELAHVDPADILAKDFSKVPGLTDQIDFELDIELSF